MSDPADITQLSALAASLRAVFGSLVVAECEVETASVALTIALGAGKDGCCELDAVDAAAVRWLMSNGRLVTLAVTLSAVLGDGR